jgi:hypothetical protein
MPKAPVLISYSSLDQQLAEKVLKALRSRNIECWAAMDGIRPGESWPAAISEAINECDILVLILTKNSNISRQVVRELTQADSHNKRLYCFQAEDLVISKDLQYFFSSTQRLEAFKKNFEKAISEMADDLQRVIGGSLKDKPEEPFVKPQNNEEDDYWKKVVSVNDAEEYLDYLTTYPNGKYKQEANTRLESLRKKRMKKEIPEPPPFPPPDPAPSKKKMITWIVLGAVAVVVLIIVIVYSGNRFAGSRDDNSNNQKDSATPMRIEPIPEDRKADSTKN